MELLTNHWAEIALAIITLLSTLTALTESTKDDKIINILSRVLQAIVMGKSRKGK